MRVVAMTLLMTAISGCMAPQVGNRLASGDVDSRSLVRNIPDIGAGVLHCDGPGANNGYVDCRDIPVIALDPDSPSTGRCVTLLPYNQLVVHVGPNKAAADVVWNLLAPAGYTFAPTAGINFTPAGAPYSGGQALANGRKFKVTIPVNAASAAAGHEARVMRSAGALDCTPVDPRIVNQP